MLFFVFLAFIFTYCCFGNVTM